MNDRELTHLRGHQIGFIFQYHHLLSAFSALENVYMPMFGELGFANNHIYERASDLLASVGLQPWTHAQASHLSGGQQQQLAIARALASGPKLLILDEPTEGIQPSIIKDIGRVIRQLADVGLQGQRMAVLLCEQYYDFAEELADHYLVMERGEVIASGPGSEMKEKNIRQLVAI
jgi:urea transport system ATP-binding protein